MQGNDMLKKGLLGFAIIAILGGSYLGYIKYTAYKEAERQETIAALERLDKEYREKRLIELRAERAEQEKQVAFEAEHFSKVLNGTGTIENKVVIDEKGIKRAEYQLIDGHIGGPYRLWREDGTKKAEGSLLTAKEYKNDYFDKPRYFGKEYQYNKYGDLENIITRNNEGKELARENFYSNGMKKSIFINDQPDRRAGEYIFWHKNGQVMSKKKRNDIGNHGWAEYWHSNGKKKCEGMYDSGGLWVGDRVGVWKVWDELGVLTAEGYFSDDKVDKSKPHLGTEEMIKECANLIL